MSRLDSRSNVNAEPLEDGEMISQGDFWLFGTIVFVITVVVAVMIAGAILS